MRNVEIWTKLIDMWGMTREVVMTGVKGKVTIPMPGKEGIVILATKE